jgi:hypothetical protein
VFPQGKTIICFIAMQTYKELIFVVIKQIGYIAPCGLEGTQLDG